MPWNFGIKIIQNYAIKFGIELANQNCFKSSSPDWTIFLWVWEKNKLLTTSRTCNPVGANAASVTQISFSPQDNTLLAVSGRFSNTRFLLARLPRNTLIGQLISIDLKTLLRKKCFKNFAISWRCSQTTGLFFQGLNYLDTPPLNLETSPLICI